MRLTMHGVSVVPVSTTCCKSWTTPLASIGMTLITCSCRPLQTGKRRSGRYTRSPTCRGIPVIADGGDGGDGRHALSRIGASRRLHVLRLWAMAACRGELQHILGIQPQWPDGVHYRRFDVVGDLAGFVG